MNNLKGGVPESGVQRFEQGEGLIHPTPPKSSINFLDAVCLSIYVSVGDWNPKSSRES